ncbi:MAG: hypothetical protein IJY04_03155, partial [Clostridia bacterium]|nr:hypothetical protein [Clostridia bacterium]
NYKHFIKGYSGMVKDLYYCTESCHSCHTEGVFCTKAGEACSDPNCPSCLKNGCNICPEELVGKRGYLNVCNSDGVCYVTEELKQFLQLYSTSQLLFFDGNGWAETNPDIKVDAQEDDQWLFACGYYVKKP